MRAVLLLATLFAQAADSAIAQSEIAWGYSIRDLQAGLSRPTHSDVVLGGQAEFNIHIRNVGRSPVKFVIMEPKMGVGTPTVLNADGSVATVLLPQCRGTILHTLTLAPGGQTIVGGFNVHFLPPNRQSIVDSPITYVEPGEVNVVGDIYVGLNLEPVNTMFRTDAITVAILDSEPASESSPEVTGDVLRLIGDYSVFEALDWLSASQSTSRAFSESFWFWRDRCQELSVQQAKIMADITENHPDENCRRIAAGLLPYTTYEPASE